ncbi:MAG: hypothetical protein KC503_16560 [Myxococcales bacterium]|nr:hypothetical protein [Myxococcales bacterium]
MIDRTLPLSTLAALAFLLAAAPASAQEIPCQNGPCVKRHRRGTHFIAELSGGATTYGHGGLALEGIFGIGGKLRGFPPRFYLIAELGYSSNTISGAAPQTGASFRDERTYRDLAAGLRIYLPIFGPIRLFGDALIGASHISASLSRDGHDLDVATGWQTLVAVGGGLQVRIFHHLSLGARFKAVVTGDDVAGLRALSGTSPTRLSATAGVTWHF